MHLSRRNFLATTVASAVGSSLLSLSGGAIAQGTGYELINPPQNTSTPNQVEVIEFLWLGCPHCYAFEPTIAAWEKQLPQNVVFTREAPPLNPSWEQHSRSFYAAQAMGHEVEFVEAMFESIHQKKKRMRKPEDIADLAAELGMDREKFLKTMKSFAVQTKLNRSIQLAQASGLTGVPSITINGKYRTGATLAGGNAGIIEVMNRTIDMEKQLMGLD